jgi:hypothetical protein
MDDPSMSLDDTMAGGQPAEQPPVIEELGELHATNPDFANNDAAAETLPIPEGMLFHLTICSASRNSEYRVAESHKQTRNQNFARLPHSHLKIPPIQLPFLPPIIP